MIITIANEKGGTKKTTTALNLASFINPDYIIDLDIHRSISVLNNLRDEDNQRAVISNASVETLAEFLSNSKDSLIIIDCGGFDSDVNRVALCAADLILIPTTESFPDLNGLYYIDDTLKSVGIENAWFFANGVHHSQKHFPKLADMQDSLERLTLLNDIAIPYSKQIQLASNKGLGINEFNKHCSSWRQYKKLADFVKKEMELVNE